MAAITRTLFVAVFALFFASSLANDVPLRFCVKGCEGGRKNVKVKLTGCIDNTAGAICTTGDDGCCVMDQWENAPHYCFGSANNKCIWSLPEDTTNSYQASASTLLRKDVGQVSPREYSCCKCNGQDTCRQKIWIDAATSKCATSDKDCWWNNFQTYGKGVEDYFTVQFNRRGCSPRRRLAQVDNTTQTDVASSSVELGEPAPIDVVLTGLITDEMVMSDNNNVASGRRRLRL